MLLLTKNQLFGSPAGSDLQANNLYLVFRMREASGLVRSKKLFGGLLNDIKRKKPFYISDFLHGLHPQCLSSFLFLYFACLAPIVAFGALLGEATENRIATIESLVSGKYLQGVPLGFDVK